MARPRKDGRPCARPIRIGTERTSAAGKKRRARSYGPTVTAPHGRVVYITSATERWTSKVPEAGRTLDQVFDEVERYLNQGVAMVTPTGDDGMPDASQRRDINALATLYLAYLTKRGRDADYVANRKSQLRKWILPEIGSVLVADWGTEHSQSVIQKARAGDLSPARVEDIGVCLSGLRKTVWRRRTGGRWLSRDDDPMEEVEYSRGATQQGASKNFIPDQKRPATSSVEKAIQTAVFVGPWAWMLEIIRLAGYCAPRLGEQLGFRGIDVDLRDRLLDINGTWTVPPSGLRAGRGKVRVGRRKPSPKNNMRRSAPYRGSQHDMLVRLCALALAQPEDTQTEEESR